MNEFKAVATGRTNDAVLHIRDRKTGTPTGETYVVREVEVELTLANETRTVWACGDDSRLFTDSIASFQKYGSKTWKGRVTLWRQKDGSLKVGMIASFLNRNGYSLRGWADVVSPNSEHNSSVTAKR